MGTFYVRGVDRELTRGCALRPPARLQPVDTFVTNRVEGSDLGADVTKRWSRGFTSHPWSHSVHHPARWVRFLAPRPWM